MKGMVKEKGKREGEESGPPFFFSQIGHWNTLVTDYLHYCLV